MTSGMRIGPFDLVDTLQRPHGWHDLEEETKLTFKRGMHQLLRTSTVSKTLTMARSAEALRQMYGAKNMLLIGYDNEGTRSTGKDIMLRLRDNYTETELRTMTSAVQQLERSLDVLESLAEAADRYQGKRRTARIWNAGASSFRGAEMSVQDEELTSELGDLAPHKRTWETMISSHHPTHVANQTGNSRRQGLPMGQSREVRNSSRVRGKKRARDDGDEGVKYALGDEARARASRSSSDLPGVMDHAAYEALRVLGHNSGYNVNDFSQSLGGHLSSGSGNLTSSPCGLNLPQIPLLDKRNQSFGPQRSSAAHPRPGYGSMDIKQSFRTDRAPKVLGRQDLPMDIAVPFAGDEIRHDIQDERTIRENDDVQRHHGSADTIPMAHSNSPRVDYYSHSADLDFPVNAFLPSFQMPRFGQSSRNPFLERPGAFSDLANPPSQGNRPLRNSAGQSQSLVPRKRRCGEKKRSRARKMGPKTFRRTPSRYTSTSSLSLSEEETDVDFREKRKKTSTPRKRTYFDNYPPRSQPIPVNSTLHRICRSYPNHIIDEGLTPFLQAGWSASMIVRNLPVDVRATEALSDSNYMQKRVGKQRRTLIQEGVLDEGGKTGFLFEAPRMFRSGASSDGSIDEGDDDPREMIVTVVERALDAARAAYEAAQADVHLAATSTTAHDAATESHQATITPSNTLSTTAMPITATSGDIVTPWLDPQSAGPVLPWMVNLQQSEDVNSQMPSSMDQLSGLLEMPALTPPSKEDGNVQADEAQIGEGGISGSMGATVDITDAFPFPTQFDPDNISLEEWSLQGYGTGFDFGGIGEDGEGVAAPPISTTTDPADQSNPVDPEK